MHHHEHKHTRTGEVGGMHACLHGRQLSYTGEPECKFHRATGDHQAKLLCTPPFTPQHSHPGCTMPAITSTAICSCQCRLRWSNRGTCVEQGGGRAQHSTSSPAHRVLPSSCAVVHATVLLRLCDAKRCTSILARPAWGWSHKHQLHSPQRPA